MSLPRRIGITLIIAEPGGAISRTYALPEGSTVDDALTLARGEGALAATLAAPLSVGIFGRLVQRNHRLQEGDRVELYRPLAEDPKAARRRRARSIKQR